MTNVVSGDHEGVVLVDASVPLFKLWLCHFCQYAKFKCLHCAFLSGINTTTVNTATQTSPVTITSVMTSTLTKERMLLTEAIHPIKSRLQAVWLLFQWYRWGRSWRLWRMSMSTVETLLWKRSTLFSTTNWWNCSSVALFVLVPVNHMNGAMVKVEQTCENCSYTRTWDSQPSTGHMAIWCCQRHWCSLAAARSSTFLALWIFSVSPDQHINTTRMSMSSPLFSKAGSKNK